MIDNAKDPNKKAKSEYELLKKLESRYLIKILGKDFHFEEFYCFITEFCDVINFIIKSS